MCFVRTVWIFFILPELSSEFLSLIIRLSVKDVLRGLTYCLNAGCAFFLVPSTASFKTLFSF